MVRPGDPRPEERLGYPTVGVPWTDISPEMEASCLAREIEYTLVHSSSKDHVDLDIAAEMLAGKRSRMSFAPMVVTAGNLMCFEVLNVILDRRSPCDDRGYFFNPWTARVERPRSWPVAWARRRLVQLFLRRLARGT